MKKFPEELREESEEKAGFMPSVSEDLEEDLDDMPGDLLVLEDEDDDE
jgi:hypothetical protein